MAGESVAQELQKGIRIYIKRYFEHFRKIVRKILSGEKCFV
jgi:hypothetical protein